MKTTPSSIVRLKRLNEHDNQDKSYLAAIIGWYNQTSWMATITLGLTCLAVAALIGSPIHLTIMFAVLASGLYLATHYFMMKAFNTRHQAQGVKDVTLHEKSEQKTTTKRINDVMQSQALIETTQLNGPDFEQDTNTLKAKIEAHIQTIMDLEKTKDVLKKEHEAIKTVLEETHLSIDNLKKEITRLNAEITLLTHTNTDLLHQNEAIRISNNELDTKLTELLTRNQESTDKSIDLADSILQKLTFAFGLPLTSTEEAMEKEKTFDAQQAPMNT